MIGPPTTQRSLIMKISFSSPSLPRTGPLVVGALSGGDLLATAERVDKATKGALTRAKNASRFKGEAGQALTVMAPSGVSASRIILIGLGEAERVDDLGAHNFGGRAWKSVASTGQKSAMVAIDPIKGSKLDTSELAANAAYGARLGSYRFDKYRTREKEGVKPSVTTLTFASRDPTKAKKSYGPLGKVADGVFLTRDLVSEPANVIYPISLAQQVRSLSRLGVKVTVLDENQMA